MTVIWKPVPGYPGYEASSDGEVRRTTFGLNGWHPHKIKGHIGSDGYLITTLCIDRCRLPVAIHRLVCLAFHGEPPSPVHQTAHGDGSRANNRPENLRWATAKENAEDREAHGRNLVGEENPISKLTVDQIWQIRESYWRGEPQRDIARRFNVHQGQVHRIIARKAWKSLPRPPAEIANNRPPPAAIYGIRKGKAKLTDSDIPAICAAVASGESQRKIAGRFGVNQSLIWRIAAGQSWAHVDRGSLA